MKHRLECMRAAFTHTGAGTWSTTAAPPPSPLGAAVVAFTEDAMSWLLAVGVVVVAVIVARLARRGLAAVGEVIEDVGEYE